MQYSVKNIIKFVKSSPICTMLTLCSYILSYDFILEAFRGIVELAVTNYWSFFEDSRLSSSNNTLVFDF